MYVRMYICICVYPTVKFYICMYMGLYYAYVYAQDKEHSIRHDDLGRDIVTVQALQRKHETFEHELEALGNQVSI